jgi:hypothetical protein
MGPFREALRDFGYVEGKNIEIEVQSAEGQATRLPNLRLNWFAGEPTLSSQCRPLPPMRRRMRRGTFRSS